MRGFTLAVLLASISATFAAEKPFLESELIFPLETWHNHSSSLVELPNQDLLVCWYHGSGERTADDVRIDAARLVKGSSTWNKPFTIADTPGISRYQSGDVSGSRSTPVAAVAGHYRNEWETALMKYRISNDYLRAGPPKWSVNDDMLFILETSRPL